MTYKEQLESPLWQKKRLKIFERDNFTCVLCDDKSTQLHVHHKKYTGKAWNAPDEDLATLCKECHFIIEHLKDIEIPEYPLSISKYDPLDKSYTIFAVFIQLPECTDLRVMFFRTEKGITTYLMAMAPRILNDVCEQLKNLSTKSTNGQTIC
jgi:hypothetical protein